MVVACVALLVALGGSAYAVTSLPKNSVGTKQLKKAAVTTPKLADHAVTASKVSANSLTGTQIKSSTLGNVPSATHAASADSATNALHATNADTLGGFGRSSFAPARSVTAGFDDLPTGLSRSFITDGPLSFSGNCTDKGGGSYQVDLSVTSTEAAVMAFSGSQAVLTANTPLTLNTLIGSSTTARSVSYSFIGSDGQQFGGVYGFAVHAGFEACAVNATAVNYGDFGG
ncbi:MAG: hypothetical protein JOZ25_04390 [Actinobacteria bacterium]|nr:hypothetical protein [Actinomycetota bacterium]